MDPKESHLVDLVLAGNTAAFEALVTPYRRPLLSLAYRLTRNEEDAKEVAQEALLRTFQYLPSFDRQKSFRNWITQILVNAARNFLSRNPRLDPLPAALPDERGPDAGELLNRREVCSRLRECLNALSAREREVFLLRDIEEHNIKETAEILGCSSASVRVHLCAARQKLGREMRRRFPAAGEKER